MDNDPIIILPGQTSLHIPWGKLTEIYDLFRCEALSAWLSPAACWEQKRRQLLEAHLEIALGPCLRCPRGSDVELPARTGRQRLVFGRGFGKIQKGGKGVKLKILQTVENYNYRIGDVLEFKNIFDPRAIYLLQRTFAERIVEQEPQDIDMREGFIAWPLQKIEMNLALKAQLPESATTKAQIGDLMKKLAARGIGIFFSKAQLELRFFPLTGTLDAGLAAIIHRHLYDILQERLEQIIFVADGIKRQWPSESKTGIIILPVEPKAARPGKADIGTTLQKELKRARVAVGKQPGFLMLWPPTLPRILLKQVQECRMALYLAVK